MATHEDVLGRGVSWLQDFRHRKLVETVKYVQDGVLIEDVHLTLAQDASTSDDGMGVIINTRQLDFLASPTEFEEKGLNAPDRGDRVIRTVNGEEIEYEVTGFGNEPAHRYMSRYRLAWRIHTLYIRSEII